MGKETDFKPKRSKRLSSIFLDGLLGVVLTTIVSFAGNAALNYLTSYQSSITRLSSSQSSMIQIIEDSKLNTKREDGTLYSLNELAEQQILSLSKGSLLYHGYEEERLSSIYKDVEPAGKNHDRTYEYFVTFKKKNKESYLQSGSYGETKYREKLEDKLDNYFIDHDYPYLQKEIVEALDESYRNSSFQKGVQIHEALQERYVSLLQEGATDLSENYIPYVMKKNAYEAAFKDFSSHKNMASLISATISIVILFVLLPGVAKGQTLAMRAFHLEYLDNHGNELSLGKGLLIGSFHVFSAPLLASIATLLTPGGNLSTLLAKCWGPTSLWLFGIISLNVCLVFYLVSFFGPRKTLPELICQINVCEKQEVIHG